MDQHIIYIGFDVHKDMMAAAVARWANGQKSISMVRSRTLQMH
jgi:hypothetical protein